MKHTRKDHLIALLSLSILGCATTTTQEDSAPQTYVIPGQTTRVIYTPLAFTAPARGAAISAGSGLASITCPQLVAAAVAEAGYEPKVRSIRGTGDVFCDVTFEGTGLQLDEYLVYATEQSKSTGETIQKGLGILSVFARGILGIQAGLATGSSLVGGAVGSASFGFADSQNARTSTLNLARLYVKDGRPLADNAYGLILRVCAGSFSRCTFVTVALPEARHERSPEELAKLIEGAKTGVRLALRLDGTPVAR
jgi:hypothetical protein